MTTRFYVPAAAIQPPHLTLPEEEARHAVKVLRLGVGDEIEVVDGEGGWYRVRLTLVGKREAAGLIAETRRDVGEKSRRVVLALGILGHRDRFEWAVEKAVELGVTDIVPLRSERAAPGGVRPARLENITIAAMKQSLRSRLPRLHDAQTPESVMRLIPGAEVLLAHEAALDAPSPADAVGRTIQPIIVLIGPEGGFSDAEVATATQSGAVVVSLGPRRLRAETAAIAALSDLMLHTI